MSSQALPPVDTVEDVFNLLETEIKLLGEHLDPSFLEQFEVFAPEPRGRTPDFDPYGLFLAHLYCFHNDIYGQRAVYRALQDETVWRQCGFPRAPSRDPIKRFRSNFSADAEAIFNYLVEQAARRGLLSPTYRIDSQVYRLQSSSNCSISAKSTAVCRFSAFGSVSETVRINLRLSLLRSNLNSTERVFRELNHRQTGSQTVS